MRPKLSDIYCRNFGIKKHSRISGSCICIFYSRTQGSPIPKLSKYICKRKEFQRTGRNLSVCEGCEGCVPAFKIPSTTGTDWIKTVTQWNGALKGWRIIRVHEKKKAIYSYSAERSTYHLSLNHSLSNALQRHLKKKFEGKLATVRRDERTGSTGIKAGPAQEFFFFHRRRFTRGF